MIQIFVLFAVFASAISVNKMLLRELSPILFVGLRMLCAGILLGCYHRMRGNVRMTWRYIRPHAGWLLLIALATTYVPSVLKAYGLQHMISSKLALIASLDPFVTVVYGYVLWGQRLQWNHVAGIVLGFSGVFYMIYMQADALPDRWWVFSLAECAALGSVCINRLGWIGVQNQLRARVYQPAELNTILMLIGGVCSLVTAWLLGEMPMISRMLSWRMIGLLSYTVFFGNVIAYAGYGQLLKSYPVTFVSLAGLSIPLFVHLYGPILLGEALSAYFFVALGLVGCGLWVFNLRRL